jgi:hypothetical protein
VPAAQRVGQQREHPAHDLGGQRRPRADGVRAHEVELQRDGVGGADADAGQVADPGRDAVDGLAGGQRAVDHRAGGRDPLAVGVGQRRRHTAASDALELLQGGHTSGTLLRAACVTFARRRPWSP